MRVIGSYIGLFSLKLSFEISFVKEEIIPTHDKGLPQRWKSGSLALRIASNANFSPLSFLGIGESEANPDGR
jgi:hypothetical protein